MPRNSDHSSVESAPDAGEPPFPEFDETVNLPELTEPPELETGNATPPLHLLRSPSAGILCVYVNAPDRYQ